MKRLLAYLFIVLGLGLTFSVKANALILEFCLNFNNEQTSPNNAFLKIAKYNSKNSQKKIKKNHTGYIGYECESFTKSQNKNFIKAITRNKKQYGWFKSKNLKNTTKDNLWVSSIYVKHYETLLDQHDLKSQLKSIKKLEILAIKQRTSYQEEQKEKRKKAIIAQREKTKKENIKLAQKEKIEQEKKKMAEEKRKIEDEKRKKAAAKKKKEEEEQKRIAEAKKKEQEEQKFRILVKKYGDDCKDNSLGSPEFNKCLKDVEAEDLLQAKLQREFLASLTPEEARAYTCNNTFGFRKGSSNFKDCIFKLYTTELELEKLDLEKQLALAKVEAEKAKADTARAQVEIIQARSAAARAEGKLQEAQIQATKAQTLSMQQQAAASRQQAAAAQAQARAAQQQNSLNLMTQGLKMLSGNQSSTRLRTNCSWSSIGISCR